MTEIIYVKKLKQYGEGHPHVIDEMGRRFNIPKKEFLRCNTIEHALHEGRGKCYIVAETDFVARIEDLQMFNITHFHLITPNRDIAVSRSQFIQFQRSRQ